MRDIVLKGGREQIAACDCATPLLIARLVKGNVFAYLLLVCV